MKKDFKKLISLILAATIVCSMTTVSLINASATKNSDDTYTPSEELMEEKKGDYMKDSAPDLSPVIPSDWERKDDGKLYFYASPELWKNYKTATVYIYEHGFSDHGQSFHLWGSKKGNMTEEGNGIWSFDFAEKGYEPEADRQYGLIFTGDWGVQTSDLIFDTSCLGDLAYVTGKCVENCYDSNKSSYEVEWLESDHDTYGSPVMITSIGNVVGRVFWEDENPQSMFKNFLTSDGSDGLWNALNFNGKTLENTVFDTGRALGLSDTQIREIAEEFGIDLNNPSTEDEPHQNDDVWFVASEVAGAIYYPDEITPEYVQSLFDRYPVSKDEVMELLYSWNFSYQYFTKMRALVEDVQENETLIRGDVNRDGVIDVSDATLVQMFAAEVITRF